MLGSFFVNNVGLFYLSALIEKTNKNNKKELTSINMPSALIEGTETVVFFSLFIVMPNYVSLLYLLFSLGICINIMQRLKNSYEILD